MYVYSKASLFSFRVFRYTTERHHGGIKQKLYPNMKAMGWGLGEGGGLGWMNKIIKYTWLQKSTKTNVLRIFILNYQDDQTN